MSVPFTSRELIKPGFFHKLFNINPKYNAIIEINNLLALKDIRSVYPDDIDKIASKYRFSIKKRYKKELCSFYKAYLKHCLSDKKLSQQELDDLKHIKHIFSLSDMDVQTVHNETTGDLYKEALKIALKDKRLNENEKAFLERLQKDILLPKQLAESIYRETGGKLLEDYLKTAVADKRLSPDQEKEFFAISKNLGIELDFDKNSLARLKKYKIYWQIENGIIPEINVAINIQRNEKCHFYTNCDWMEYRKVLKGVSYAGPTIRYRLAKGIYYRAGNLALKKISGDELMVLDSGRTYITNKRIIFIGRQGNKNILLKNILSFNLYSNGVEIQKDRGKTPFLRFKDNVDLFGLILDRLLFS